MAFDLATAMPVKKGGFDLATAKPVGVTTAGAAAIPGASAEQQAAARAGMAQQPEQQDNLLGKVVSPVDAALGLASSIVTPVVAVPGGFIKSAYDELTGGPSRSPEENAVAIRNRIQYQPATATGRRILETIGEAAPVLEALPGMAGEVSQLGRSVASGTGALRNLAAPTAAIQNAADEAAAAGSGRLRDLVRKPQEPSLSGVGAARSPEATVRQQRAANLGLSPLTEGQATREPSQVRFERNTAKTPEGGPLNNRFVQHNQELLGKFSEFADETGAQTGTLRAAGGVVNDALVAEYNAAKAKVRDAYAKAREAGQLEEPVSYKGLSDYLAQHTAEIETNNVPMLNYVRSKLAQLDPEGTGVLTVNQLEELRKGAGRLTQDGTPNAAFIGDVKRAIDASTENAAGQLYQQARRLNQNMANRFENVGAVDKLLRTKRGTNDRAVAVENVVDHVLVNGSLDDMLNVRRALTASGGEQGAQAWRELQGAGINRLRDALFPENGAQDSAGNILPRPSALKKLVTDLDNEGKLQRLYGKQGAQQIRDLADAAVDVNYQTGANTSGTGADIRDLFQQKTNSLLKRLPGVGPLVDYAASRAEAKATQQRVSRALGQQEQR